jgi:hypothetical protein
VSTIAAGGAPESISVMAVTNPSLQVARFVVWANRTELQVFGFVGGAPQPLFGLATAPADWNPTQMFPANESIALFDAAHPGLYGFDRMFSPGLPDELPPYQFSPIGAEPAGATALSTPMHRFWTDGSTIDGL